MPPNFTPVSSSETAWNSLRKKCISNHDKTWTKKTDLTRQEVLQLTKILVSEPYFQCEEGFFNQSKGTPMGGPLSRFFADLIIENKIEAKIQSNRAWKGHFNWVRLVDDTFFNWTGTIDDLHRFKDFLNSLYGPIKWTMEIEENNTFHIFDIQLHRIGDKIETSVYRKPSASDRYLHFTSAQALHERLAAIHTLTKRAHDYCSTKALLEAELSYIKSIFVDNGFPLEVIENVLNRKSQQWESESNVDILDENANDTPEVDYSKAYYAPYHPKAAKMFRTLKKKFNIDCVYKKTTTLGNYFFKRRPKQDIWDTTHVCYQVPCGECPMKYIGHTKRKLRTRVLKEHKRSCEGDLSNIQPNQTNDNGIPFHHATTGHSFKFEDTIILERERNKFKRMVLEGMHIYSNKDNVVNIKSGLTIDNCWSPFVKELGFPGKGQ